MEFAVLIKIVPAVEQLRFDPERKTMIREGVELSINPFDSRAVRVALDLRRPGESVTVVSMGPPVAERTLTECLALGADRAILVSDRLLAGSDTLVTSRVLARTLARVGHDLVVTGKWSTDSETGQVGPEVAALLGAPVVSAARSIDRDPDGSGFEVVGDTDDGWVRFRVVPPALISVGEKIAKPRKPTPEESSTAHGRTLETLGAADLGLSPKSVGLSGSPTVVTHLVNEEPTRTPEVFRDGDVETRVRATVEAIARRLSTPRPSALPLPPLPDRLGDKQEAVVLVSNSSGELERRALPLVSEIRRAPGALWPTVLWVGPGPAEEDRTRLAMAGAARGYVARTGRSEVDSRSATLAFEELLERHSRVAAGAFVSEPFGREVAGQLAARRSLGLTGDAVGLTVDEDGRILWRKPAFGGGVVADIFSRTTPSLATVRAGVFEEGTDPAAGPVSWELLSDVPDPPGVERVGRGSELDPAWGSLDTARAVLVVGMGVGGPERVTELMPALARWNAALAATRRVVDSGWLPRQLQVGLTGRSLAPELAVLVGVGGATNHMVGWRRARTILAINSNPNAPVFRQVDVGLVGDWSVALPLLVEALEPVLARPATPPT